MSWRTRLAVLFLALCVQGRPAALAGVLAQGQAVPVLETHTLQPHVKEVFEHARARVLAQRTSASAWSALGSLLLAHRLFEPAEECLREAQRLAPDRFRERYLLAHALDRNGRALEETVAMYRSALAREPGYLAGWRALGVLWQREGHWVEASAALERALEGDPSYVSARLVLGQVLLSCGEIEAATEHLERVYTRAPDDRAVLAALSQAYLRAGTRERAREYARRCAGKSFGLDDRDPLLEDVRGLGRSKFDTRERAERALAERRWADAIVDLELFLRGRAGSPVLRYQLARALAATGQPQRAVVALQAALEQKADFPDAHVLLARLVIHGPKKRPGVARKHLALVLEQEPSHIEALALQAALHAHLEQYEEAERLFARVSSLCARPASAGAVPYRPNETDRLVRGRALFALGLFEEARAEFESVVRSKPQAPQAHFRLAAVYERLGRRSDALAQLEIAGRLDPRLPVAARIRELHRAQR